MYLLSGKNGSLLYIYKYKIHINSLLSDHIVQMVLHDKMLRTDIQYSSTKAEN